MSITVVVRDRTEALSFRHLDPTDKTEVTIASGTVTIYKDGATVVSAAVVTNTGTSLAQYSTTWSAATFPIGRYRAEWTLVDGSAVTRVQDQEFEVSLRRFTCPIGKSDFEAKYPLLEERLPTGTTFATYLEAAWDYIELQLYGRRQQYPGNIFFTDIFRQTAEYWTLADIYEALVRKPGTEDEYKATLYRKRALEAFESAVAFVRADTNDDNIAGDNEYEILSSGRLRR